MESKMRVPLPPDPNPTKPKFALPPGTCDTHFHVMGPPQAFPLVESRLYTPPAAPIEHWLGMAKAIGIERGVMVVPAVHGFDNAPMHDAIAKAEGRLKGMIRANPALSEADNKKLHAQGVRGIRFNARNELEGHFDKDEMQLVVSRLGDLPWAVDFHIDPELMIEHAELISRIQKSVIIDHFGTCDPAKGVDQPAFRVLLDLVGRPNIYVKISSLDRYLYSGKKYEDVCTLSRALTAKAPDRVIWGTDWPHAYVYQHGRMVNDGELASWLLDLVPDAAVRKKVLVDNPARLFGF